MPNSVEVEAKIELQSCNEVDNVIKKLENIGAKKEAQVYEEDIYFQHPCRDFAKTDEALRLRVISKRVELTYKGSKTIVGGSKTRTEYTVTLSDLRQAKLILESLGFKPVASVRKRRMYYSYGEVNISVDKVEGLGCFIEVEYRGEGSIKAAINTINTVIDMLGLTGYKRVYKSYLELILEKEDKDLVKG